MVALILARFDMRRHLNSKTSATLILVQLLNGA
jgi:hypothetical protein